MTRIIIKYPSSKDVEQFGVSDSTRGGGGVKNEAFT